MRIRRGSCCPRNRRKSRSSARECTRGSDPALSHPHRSRLLPNTRARMETPLDPPPHLRAKLGRLFLPFPLSRYSIVSREAAGQWWAESHSAGSRRFAGTAHAPLRQKNGLRSFSVRETFMALASGLVTAVDDQEQAAAGLSNATPALLPPTIDCHRKLADGRLRHRNWPFVLVVATGWVCPEDDLCPTRSVGTPGVASGSSGARQITANAAGASRDNCG